MSAYASVNGVRIVSGSLVIPFYGMWVADFVLATPDLISDPCTVVLGDLTLKGAIIRTDSFAGQREVRLVAGAGGWRLGVSQQAYSNPAGVPLSMVLTDAAREVGETVKIAVDRQVGIAFTREMAPAERVLKQEAGPWWIDNAGVTQVGPRVGGPITSHFDVIKYDGGRGQFEIATEVMGDWMPGRTFTSPTVPAVQTISMTRIAAEGDGKTRLMVLVTEQTLEDRLLDALRKIIRSELATLTYLGHYLYVVQSTDGTIVEAVPEDTGIPLPSIRCALWPSILGEQVTPSVGAKCVVAFLNGDPTRPVCIAGDPASTPSQAKILNGSKGVARVGDSVTITSAEILAAGMVAGSSPVTIANPLVCKITSGSTEVTCG